MAKRFTDTDKFKRSFIRGLPGAYKLFWDYLYHDCNNAGIWIADFEIAQLYIGEDMPINREIAIELFNKDEMRVYPFDGGKKWFIVPFIAFQYGELNKSNRAHRSVIEAIEKHGLSDLLKKNKPLTDCTEGATKPLGSPLQGAKDKDKDKDILSLVVKKGGAGENEPSEVEAAFSAAGYTTVPSAVWTWDYPLDWIRSALTAATETKGTSPPVQYLHGILRRYATQGGPDKGHPPRKTGGRETVTEHNERVALAVIAKMEAAENARQNAEN